jgi:hypothetical protein
LYYKLFLSNEETDHMQKYWYTSRIELDGGSHAKILVGSGHKNRGKWGKGRYT